MPTGHASPLGGQKYGAGHPRRSIPPGQAIASPQSGGVGSAGHPTAVHPTTSSIQEDGPTHPLGPISPGQLIIPSPQTNGGSSGQMVSCPLTCIKAAANMKTTTLTFMMTINC